MAQQAPVLKELKCPNCGAALQQHLATTQAIVCASCGTYVAIGMEEAQILSKGASKIPAPPMPIFPGDHAKLMDTEFFVMGRVLYRGWDDEDRWHWTEWLLGGKDGQLLWLSYDDEAGFVAFRKLRVRVPFNPDEDTSIPTGDGSNRAMVTERYPARIVAAEGELTWQAKAGESLTMVEGKRGNFHYSVQKTEQEIEIYEGTPLNIQTVAEAFGHQKWLQQIKSQGQSRTVMALVGGVALVLAIFSAIFGVGTSFMSSKSLVEKNIVLTTGATPSPFPVTINGARRPAMVKVEMLGSLPMNTAAEVEVSVEDPDGEDFYEMNPEFWHESGYDEGYWEENDYKGSGRFVPPEKGQYLFTVALGEKSSGIESVNVKVSVYENTFLPTWFWLYAAVAAIFGMGVFFLGFGEVHSGVLAMLEDD